MVTRPLICLILVLAAAAPCAAQYAVNLTLQRTNYLALEAIAASVTITNRSGDEVVLGGPGRAAWLSFEMTDLNGRPLAPMEVSGTDMVQIPPGGTIQRRVTVTDAYAPSDMGNYGLMARVLHPPTGQHYGSNRVRFNITDAKPMWKQSFGVPKEFKGAGSARSYAVLLFVDNDSTSLYARLIDDASGLRLHTIKLGPVTMALDPQMTLDKANHLQVLFLAQPHLWAHCVVAPDGSLKKRAYYREEEGNRPQLNLSATGDVAVSNTFSSPVASC
jgi:hypothetical protein